MWHSVCRELALQGNCTSGAQCKYAHDESELPAPRAAGAVVKEEGRLTCQRGFLDPLLLGLGQLSKVLRVHANDMLSTRQRCASSTSRLWEIAAQTTTLLAFACPCFTSMSRLVLLRVSSGDASTYVM